MRVIETARLTLEPQVATHAEEMFAILCDPAIYEFENAPPPSVEGLRARFGKLESRRSADGREHWLNWVVRKRGAEAIGYVQATVDEDGRAAIAYEFASAYWGRGLATEAIEGMIAALADDYGVRHFSAVLKRANGRSMRLLERLGFSPAPPEAGARAAIGDDEALMERDFR
jgi:RimJ/RimL family protein N-acetyltransferase